MSCNIAARCELICVISRKLAFLTTPTQLHFHAQVADVKRMNGLVTDLQMFALKTLKIPLPGRHPPSSPNSLG